MSTQRADPSSASTPLELLLRRASRTARKLSGVRPLEGFVDRVLAGEVLGWAFDPNKPDRRVHVVARFEGEIIAETLADLPRKDLSRGGKGDGRHGFNLRIPGRYLDGSPRRLRIEALDGRSRVLLQGGAITIAAARPGLTPASPPVLAAAAEPGRLEQVRDGVLSGWVAPSSPGQAAPVIDIYDDERYLGSATANPAALDPSTGEAPFAFSLPVAPDEELLRRLRARATGARADLRPLPGQGRPRPRPAQRQGARDGAARPRGRAARVAPAEGRLALLVHGEGDADAVRRTARSWTEQSWSDIAIGRLSPAPERSSPAGEHVFTGADGERLAAFMAGARTVVLARAGETLEPYAAKVLAQARPLSDVLTWEIADRSPGASMRRRVEAWPLAIQLGASLNGGFAVRTDALAPLLEGRLDDLAAGRMTGIELALAANSGLRWSHLPLALSARAPGGISEHRLSIVPSRRARSISIAVWPRWSEESLPSLRSLLAQVGDIEIEVLVAAEDPPAYLRDRLADTAPGARITVRPVDAPAQDRPGAWHRVMARAATGEVLVLCRAGVILDGEGGGAVDDMAGWALSPLVGAVTGEIRAGDQVLAGLALAPMRHGWRIVSGYQPALAGISRPVLACSAALMAVERGRVEAAGGFDAHRLPDGGAGFDIGLKLRRAGFSSLVLGHVRATAEPDAGVLRRDPGAVLALHEAGELAAAAAAYPAFVEPRAKPQDEA